ncbi:MAG: hypothetical protein LBS55_08765 [Prevotellaceae bacterium]|jgi:hypothetical protein|nr:hypothetical protein [Prevotellaceae bacterium]
MTNKLFLRKFLVAALLIFLALNAIAQEVFDLTHKRAKVDDFMIFPWGGVPTPDFASGAWGNMTSPTDLMKDLFDCGYNATGFIPTKYVPAAINCRLAVILYDERIASYPEVTPQQAEKTVQTVLNEIKSPELRKAIYSIYIKDEPNASLFPRLSLWSEAICKHKILPYINLFPDYASDKQLGSDDYEAHLDEFVNTCNPKYVSYDNYSLFAGNKFDENRFYGNLETVRKKSLQYGIPFWNVILGNTHFHYIEPSPATLGIQVYSTLAYGGKGIGYFTHYAPEIGNYRLAPIDQFGHKTKTWEMIRSINLQIHSLASVYCTLKSVNVFHTDNVPKNAQGIESTVHLKSISEGKFLVGEFVDFNGNPYLFIVNKDIQNSVQLKVSFKKEGKIVFVSPYGKGKVRFEGEQNWLAPGAGVLLTVE